MTTQLRCIFCALAACFALSACSRDLQLPAPPPPPGPGLVQGRVVYARPGRAQPEPAAGAEVLLLNSSLATRANAEGRFLLDGLRAADGEVLVRFDVEGDGVYERQKLLRLADLGAGPGRQLALGDVVVGQTGRVVGHVLRGDLGGVTSGHAGTSVFVPGGPFITQAGDDGTFVLDGLPEGALRLGLMRPGFVSQVVDNLALGSGQELSLAPIALAVDVAPRVPGTLSGHVLQVDGQGVPGAQVRLSGGPTALTASVQTSGAWLATAVDEGRYDVFVEAPGFLTAQLFNAIVTRGGETTTPDVVLLRVSSASGTGDGGTPSLVVPGGLDAGVWPTIPDGGFTVPDAGPAPSDAGPAPFDAGFQGCVPRDAGTHAPTAVIDPLPMVVARGELVPLQGGHSTDPDCQVLRFTWSESTDAGVTFAPNDSTVAASPSAWAPNATTELRFGLVVTDPDGYTGTSPEARVQVVGRPTNELVATPASATWRPDGGAAGPVLLEANTIDPQGYPLTWVWSVVSGPGQLTNIDGGTATLVPTGLGDVAVVVNAANAFLANAQPAQITVAVALPSASAFQVSILGPTTLGSSATVSFEALVTGGDPGEAFQAAWTSSPAGLTLQPQSFLKTNAVAPAASGTFTITAEVVSLSSGRKVTQSKSVTVVATQPIGVQASRPSMDAGVATDASPVVAWVRWNQPLDPGLINASNIRVENAAQVVQPAAISWEATTHTIQLVYDEPLTPGSYTLFIAPMKDLQGLSGPSYAVPFTIGAMRLGFEMQGPQAFTSADELRPGATWVMGSLVATMNRHDVGPSLPCTGAACFAAFGTDSNEPLSGSATLTSGSFQVSHRRAVSAGGRTSAWGSNLDWMERAPPTTPGGPSTWTKSPNTPPGPVFVMGEALAALGMVGMTPYVWDQMVAANGVWVQGAQLPTPMDATPLRSALASDGATSWAVITSSTADAAWSARSGKGAWSGYGGPGIPIHAGDEVRLVHAMGKPVAVTRHTDGTLDAIIWNNANWVALPVSLGPVAGFDAVSLGWNVYVAWVEGGQLKGASLDYANTTPALVPLLRANDGSAVLNSPLGCQPGFPELAASGYGLGLAWSEKCSTSGATWTYFTRKL